MCQCMLLFNYQISTKIYYNPPPLTRTQLYWDLPQKAVKFGEACPKLEIWQFVEILYECGTHPTKNKNQGSFSETVIYLAVWDPY